MIELESAADKYVLRDRDVEIFFRVMGDRWQHAVSVCRDDGWLTVLTSDEGGPADQILPSPAFQELRCEQPAKGIYEFQLFGRSGKGVYSAAMRYDAADRSLDFDLCARGPGDSPLCTFCTYRLAGPEDLEEVQNDAISVVLVPALFRPIQIATLPIAASPAGGCRLSGATGERRLAVGCFEMTGAPVAGKPASVRWRLRIECSPAVAAFA
jgi:hypothetical protein